jgi:hypothetical protein
MNHFSPSTPEPDHSRPYVQRFFPSPFLIGIWVITLLLMMIVAAIALKGLVEPDLLNPNIVNPATPEQPLTPSPIPVPQLVITPNIPKPPEAGQTPTIPSTNFPLWIFVSILGGSAFISLLVTGWLRYLSLPPEDQDSIAYSVSIYSNFIFRVITGIFNLLKNIILSIFKLGINSLKFLAQQSDHTSPPRKVKPKKHKNYAPIPEPEYNNPVEPIYHDSYGYTNPLGFNQTSPAFNLAQEEYNRANFASQPNRKSPQKQNKPKPPQKPRSEMSKQKYTAKKSRKKSVTPSRPPVYGDYIPPQASAYYQPQVTILKPEEQTPLDQRKPSLAEMMDLRRSQSLSSLLGDSSYQ